MWPPKKKNKQTNKKIGENSPKTTLKMQHEFSQIFHLKEKILD
jgi:hypothetical protein